MDEQTLVSGPPAPSDDELFWGAAPPPSDPKPGGSRRRWLGAVAGAAAIGVGAVVGINVVSSHSRTIATGGNGPNGAGGPGSFGGRDFGGGPGSTGTIASISGSTITMTTATGETVKVTTSGSTTFTASTSAAFADVKVGDNVVVIGDTNGTTVNAQQVTDSGTVANGNAQAAPGGAPPGPGAGVGGLPTAGVVKSVGNGSFTVTTDNGAVVHVTTSSATTFSLVRDGSLGALEVGDEIRVIGTTDSAGTIAATGVRAAS